jgi:hypothetical protein
MLIIQNFVGVGKGRLFACAVQSLQLAIRRRLHLDSVCTIITELKGDLGELVDPVARDLFDLIETTDEKLTALTCLNSISHEKGVDEIVFDRLDILFALLNRPEDEELLTATLLLCASLRNPTHMKALEPAIPTLLAVARVPKIQVATAAAQCLLTIATGRPELLDVQADEILRVSEKATGELLRLCLQIREKLFGIRHRK